jgi:cobaltochelatase CobT
MPGPFPDRTVEAVAACARVLAGEAGAGIALAAGGAATLGGLRAHGDRQALRLRHHDSRVYRQHRPDDPRAAIACDALEQARLDALGARWLRGVAQNLTAHPGADPDGLRWLAFELFGGHPPADRRGPAARARAALPPTLVLGLGRLGALLADHAAFAPEAAAWARTAAAHLPPPEARSAANPFPMSRPATVRRLPRRGDPGGSAAPLRGRGQDEDGGDEPAGAGARTGGTGPGDAYRVYTTAHDRVVNAAALATRAELVDLHAELDAELGGVRSVVARLAKQLMRVLMSRQERHWRFDLDEGVLDGSRLGPFIAGGGRARPFKAEGESPFPSTVVTLLIDHSGSMRGRPMRIAALAVEIFARVLERCGVTCEVLGFTTRDWDGGAPARQWAADGYPEAPGRLNALEHVVIKSADVPWRRARIALGLFLRDEMLKENIDGEALDWAHRRLLARSETRRILLVVSDGTPMDEATLAANGYEYLERHLKTVIAGIEARSPVQLAAIGIGHDVSLFYDNATTIASVDELGPALGARLTELLQAPPRTVRPARRRVAARSAR